MQFNLVNNKEMLVFLRAYVHDEAVCLAVSGLRHTSTGSHRSCSFSVAPIWNHVGESVLQPSFFLLSGCFSALVLFLFFCLPPSTPPPFYFIFPLLSQCDGCPYVPVWGLMAGLWGLLAMGVFYCLGAD